VEIMWKVLWSVYDVCEVIWVGLLLYSSVSSSQRSVTLPGCFIISSSLISVSKCKGTLFVL